eukprot:CAMPEP_0172435148 /NCGR_PEP_ID=MMETSP1064-20121228/71017_1 /TAXON_ID=202472 /ORGANISM="Aulacoseira subarctica , Strain CCAP 1002/5" /LENGTH=240 /DNA_ID=CAMNT_0013183429 /DNA_START=139 /DNA_END=862 /DNA_ORIENTATION=-
MYHGAVNKASREDKGILCFEQRASHRSFSEQEHVQNELSQKSVTITAPFYYPEAANDMSLLHNIYVQPCLSKEEAATCLSMARKHAQATGCWDQSTGRHTNYNTVDFEVEDSEDLSNYLNDIGFHNRITQQLSDAYDIDWSYITFLDLFCSNYEAKQKKRINDDNEQQQKSTTMDSLVMHRNGSLLSFSVVSENGASQKDERGMCQLHRLAACSKGDTDEDTLGMLCNANQEAIASPDIF